MIDYNEDEIKRNYWYMYVNDIVHDGCTEEFSMSFSILYPLFLITGLGIFIKICLHWNRIKSKVKDSD